MSEAAEKKTPLYEEHVRLGARMVPFGGWLMPVQYSSIVDEHQAVRNALGMFDISHMGQFIVVGRWRARLAQQHADQQCREARRRRKGNTLFSSMRTAAIIDDLIVYRIGEAEFLLVVNASKIEEDFAWLERHRPGEVTTNKSQRGFWRRSRFRDRASSNFSATCWWQTAKLPARNHIVDFRCFRHAGFDRAHRLHRRRWRRSFLSGERRGEVLE